MRKKLLTKIFFILFFFPQHSKSEIISGMAKVIDGDTIMVNKNKIRFYGIDAPEIKQTCIRNYLQLSFFSFHKKYQCGEISKKKLKKLIKNKNIKCYVEGKDIYKRKIAECYRGKININSWMVRNGFAVVYTKYSNKYLTEETLAKQEKLGIWQGKFEKPWDWRKNVKKK